MKTTRLLSVLLLTMFTSAMMAQPACSGHRAGEKPIQNKEQIRAEKVAFITSKLQLTAEEAERFWPVFNAHQEAIQRSRETRKGTQQDYHKMNYDSLTDEQALAMCRQRLAHREKMLAIDRDYNQQYLNVLSPKKVLLLYDCERGFQRHQHDEKRKNH